jgi:ATP-dependent exoDNAse (exonuclease V) beta subunit
MQIEPILSERNSHPRDKFVKFHENGHKYEITCDPDSKYTSVTTWNHSHFPKFDADLVIKNMMRGKNWKPGHKYWGMTVEEIKESWNKNKDSVASAGTNMHAKIECFMNCLELKEVEYNHDDLFKKHTSVMGSGEENTPDEWNYFLKFIEDHKKMKPYRTEWMIFHEDVKLAGSIDMVYENEDGTLEIYDWKRSKDITKINTWNKFATNKIINNLPDSNFWHYALQLNTYRKILEDKYGKKVVKLCLVRLHPDNEDDTYELLNVPLLDKEMELLFEEKRNLVLKEMEEKQKQEYKEDNAKTT